jgi:hypothetical protein
VREVGTVSSFPSEEEKDEEGGVRVRPLRR